MSAASTASGEWREVLHVLNFARARFDQWGHNGILSAQDAREGEGRCAARRRSAAEAARAGGPVPPEIALPPLKPGPEKFTVELRCWEFLSGEVERQVRDGSLSPGNARRCQAEVDDRIAYLRQILVNAPGADAPLVTAAQMKPRRSLIELLLEPRTIQWFLAFGGGLFVLGLVLWLASMGIFENKLVVASALGVANAAVLFGGWALIRRTRYQIAGRALTLLACLVMPLNLWFYHAQGLITLDGHLWVAGVVVCAFYAASAWVLQDWMFVPVLMGGVTMTGLLLLADLGKFAEVAAPSTFLVLLGLIGIHVERAFPPDDSPFGRRRFGLAFFYSGHAALAGGLFLLLGAQLAGHWLYPLFEATFRNLEAVPSPVVTETWGRLLAFGLVLAGVYANLYSDLVVRRLGIYIAFAAAGLLWTEVLGLELLNVHVGAEVVLATLAVTALAANFAAVYAPWTTREATGESAALRTPRFAYLALALALVPVVIGALLHARATPPLLPQWTYEGGWAFVGAMAIAAASCRVAAYLYRYAAPKLAGVYLFATAAAEVITAAGLLRQLGLTRWDQQAWALMLIPLAHSVAAYLYRGRPWAGPVLAAGHAVTAVMIASSVFTTVTSFTTFRSAVMTVHAGQTLNLTLAGFFALAGLFYLLSAMLHQEKGGVYLATVTICLAVWQALLYIQVPAEYHSLAFAGLGLALLVGHRVGRPTESRFGRSKAVFESANALLSVAFVAAALLGLKRLTMRDVQWLFVVLCATLTAVAVLSATFVRHSGWRRWYVVMAIAQALLTILGVEVLSTLTAWQKAELFAVLAGTVLLAVGLAGWYREQEQQNDFVSFALTAGSLFIGVPLAIAVLYHRSYFYFSWPNEFGLLAGGLVLLGCGFIGQLRVPTITGAAMVTLYVVTILMFGRFLLEQVQTAALLLAIGGGVIFGTGVILAVYRDRLLALPAKVRNREGIFRVLSWR